MLNVAADKRMVLAGATGHGTAAAACSGSLQDPFSGRLLCDVAHTIHFTGHELVWNRRALHRRSKPSGWCSQFVAGVVAISGERGCSPLRDKLRGPTHMRGQLCNGINMNR